MSKQKHGIGYQKRRKRDIKQRRIREDDLRNTKPKQS